MSSHGIFRPIRATGWLPFPRADIDPIRAADGGHKITGQNDEWGPNSSMKRQPGFPAIPV